MNIKHINFKSLCDKLSNLDRSNMNDRKQIMYIFNQDSTYNLFSSSSLSLDNKLKIVSYMYPVGGYKKYIDHLLEVISNSIINVENIDTISETLKNQSQYVALLSILDKFNYKELPDKSKIILSEILSYNENLYNRDQYIRALLAVLSDFNLKIDRKIKDKLKDKRERIIYPDILLDQKEEEDKKQNIVPLVKPLTDYFDGVMYPVMKFNIGMQKIQKIAPKVLNDHRIQKEIKVIPVSGNGNCLFNAVFNSSYEVRSHIKSLDKRITNGSKLRSYITKVLVQKKEPIYGKVKELCETRSNELFDLNKIIKVFKEDKTYLDEVMDISPNIVGLVLGVNIHIYQVNCTPQKYNYSDNERLDISLRLEGRHYELVQLSEDFNISKSYEDAVENIRFISHFVNQKNKSSSDSINTLPFSSSRQEVNLEKNINITI